MQMTLQRFRIFFVILLLFQIPASAARTFSRNHWNLRLGATVSNLAQRLSAPDGFDSKVSQIQGLLGIQRQLYFSKKWGISPDIYVWLPWRNGADGTTLTFTSHLAVPFFWELWSGFQLFLGPGIFWESHFSKQEAILLGNGGGSSTFYTPWRTRLVILPSVFGGTKFNLSKRMGLFLGVVVPEAFHSDKRRWHAAGGISIRI